MIHKTTRSILSVLLAALLLVTSTPLTPAFAGVGEAVSPQSESGEGRELEGTGTKDNPYKIATAEELREFAKLVNGGKTDASAVLTDDIDLNPNMEIDEDGTVTNGNEPDRWTPIGNSESTAYTGTFDGNGKTISGLYIDSSSDNYQGLFGYVSGTVQNLSVSGSVSGNYSVGGVVGLNRGSVEDCDFTGSVSGDRCVGGVVGSNSFSATVKNCYNTGAVSGGVEVGGVVGSNSFSATVTNCYNTGTVTSSGSTVGGVVGNNEASVENCYNTGTITGTDDYVGGVVGYNSGIGSGSDPGADVVGDNDGGSVTNCTNTGSVTSSGDCVGGVVGYNDSGSVTNSYNTGTVSVSGNSVGGVVGENSGSVTNCYNTGSVSGPDSVSGNTVGGVVGYNSRIVENCYNTGAVNSSGNSSVVGGVVGYNNDGSDGSDGSGNVTGCYFLKTADVNSKLPGIGVGGSEPDETPVDDLNALCGKFENDHWTISDTLKRPVLTSNHEDDGSKDHPYEIFTATQLAAFRDLVNGEGAQTADTDAHAKLMNNIDLKDVCGPELDAESPVSWTPIGNSEESAYIGTFDGNGNTISGLYIGSSGVDYKGLFGRVNGGTVQNLTVSGNVSGDRHVGGVVGYNSSGTVTGCIFSGSGSVSGVTGSDYVGGIVGYNGTGGTVENCYNTGSVTATGSDGRVGGVVGQNFGGVKNCYNTGAVSGSGLYVGGVVGNNEASVTNCYNIGNVTSSGNYVGGVVGDNSGTVENCYNTGSVSGPDSGFNNAVGGVVGLNSSGDSSASASVTNCYNTGKVTGSADSSDVGGVVGYNSSASVANCYYQTGKGAAVGIGGTTGDNSSQTAAKSLEDFHSGEVAYLLEKGVTDEKPVWGQDLTDKNSLPTLVALDKNAKTVYQVTLKYDHAGAQDKTYYTDDTATPSEQPSRDGYTFDHWDKTEGEGNTITYTAQWTPVADPDPEPEEPPYTGKYSYELSTSVGDHGTVTVDRYATEGDKVTITVSPDEAYKLDDLVVTAGGKDVELTANSDGTYSFTMPSADVRITATFAEDPDWTEPEEPATDVSDLFSDIAPDAWYKDAVQYAYDNGLMTGTSATTFEPEATTTRAMIVSILARLEGVTTAQAAGFADVDDNDWYATAVNWAANVGVVNGYEDNTFQPNTPITREQLAAILMNYAAYKGYDVSARADLSHYSDADSISSWANDVLLWAVAEGLLTGVTDDTIAPQAHATRAQVAAILQRFLSE